MAFSNKPLFLDRSKGRSPVTPKRSPCQTIPRLEAGLTLKRSSPVFTRSPSRQEAVEHRRPCMPCMRGLAKTPDHHKENGHSESFKSSPASGKYCRSSKNVAFSTKPPVAASPKKILGDHNDTVISAKKCRKEWQIPTASAIELKESLSGMESPIETENVVDQASSFPVICEGVGESESTLDRLRKHSSRSSQKDTSDAASNKFPSTARNLFGAPKVQIFVGKEEWIEEAKLDTTVLCMKDNTLDISAYPPAVCSPTSQHSSAASSSVDTTHDEEHSSKLEQQFESVNTVSQPKENTSERSGLTDCSNESSTVLSDTSVRAASSESKETEDVGKLNDSSLDEAVINDSVAVTEKEGSTCSSVARAFLWSSLLGCFVALILMTAGVLSRGNALNELWESSQYHKMALFSSEVVWTTQTDLVGFHVDPQQLHMNARTLSWGLVSNLQSLYARVVPADELRRYKLRVETFVIRSIKFVGSYYSSLVLKIHATDMLFNYCDKFQGHYYRLRLALVSAIEQITPLEAPARNVIVKGSYDGMRPPLLSSLEHFACKTLVESYLNIAAACFLEESVVQDNIKVEVGSETGKLPASDEELQYPVSSNEALVDPETITAEAEQFSYPVDWSKDVLSMCKNPDLRSERGPLSFIHAEHESSKLPDTQVVAEFVDPNAEMNMELGGKKFEGIALYLIAASASSMFAVLGFYCFYAALKYGKAATNAAEFAPRLVNPSGLSTPEKMRLRGAEEELIMSPEQSRDSPFGSFTAYKPIVYNEGTEKEQVRLTPVRRSNRIRSQLQSPHRLN